MTDNLFDKIKDEMDPFKKILSIIPGFKGYMERQARRDSDKLLRETIADRFEQQWERISAIQRDFIASGDIQYLDDLEGAAIKLRTFADRVRRATRGYSGLFDAVKINEEELQQLYLYDSQMLELAEEVGRAIDNVEARSMQTGFQQPGTQDCRPAKHRRFDRREGDFELEPGAVK
jgi:hypothetical protein